LSATAAEIATRIGLEAHVFTDDKEADSVRPTTVLLGVVLSL
jgi:hypothetical protein